MPRRTGGAGPRRRGASHRQSRVGPRNTCVNFRGTLFDVNYAPVLTNHQQMIPAHFPWLRELALQFSQYRVRSLAVKWVPAGAATDSGQVVGGYTFDSFENAPTTYAQVSQLSQHRLGPVHKSITWSMPVSRLSKQWWPVIAEDALGSLPLSERAIYLPALFHLGLRSDRQNGQLAGSIEVIYSIDFAFPDFTGSQNAPVPPPGPSIQQLLDSKSSYIEVASDDEGDD